MVNWKVYSSVYDLMSLNNPAYQNLLGEFESFVKSIELSQEDEIIDIGAGTGNFLNLISNVHPNSKYTYLDSDEAMMIEAKRKLHEYKVNFINADFSKYDFGKEKYSLVIMIHSLYTTLDYQKVLFRINRSLKKDGRLFIIDFGRQTNILFWTYFMFKSSCKKNGFFTTLDLFRKGKDIKTQNKLIQNNQKNGNYWVHTHEEFLKEIEKANFSVSFNKIVYQGFSDLVIAKKMPH